QEQMLLEQSLVTYKIEGNYFLINLEVAFPSSVIISIKYIPADKSETFTEKASFCTFITLPVTSVTLISFTFNPLTEVMFNTSVTGFGYTEKFSLKKSFTFVVVKSVTIILSI